MAVSKVQYKSSPSATPEVWMDATSATAAAEDILSPKTAMLANGVVTTGTGTGGSSKYTDLVPASFVPNQYVALDGSFVAYNGWSRTDYIDISGYESLIVSSSANSGYNVFYDANHGFIESFGIRLLKEQEIPSNAVYVAMSNTDQGMADLVAIGVAP